MYNLIFYFFVLSLVIIRKFHFRIMDKLQFISNRDSVAYMEFQNKAVLGFFNISARSTSWNEHGLLSCSFIRTSV